jgi:hypothetical protein
MGQWRALFVPAIVFLVLRSVDEKILPPSEFYSSRAISADSLLPPSISGDVVQSQNDNPMLTQSSLHICRSSELPFKPKSITMRYTCKGEEYDDFGKHLIAFANNSSVHGLHWGRRQYPIPDNKTVLMMGNSHTRQLIHALVCQYNAVLESILPCHSCKAPGHFVFTARFRNNATLFVSTNNYIVYTRRFVTLLEQTTLEGRSLESVDAIVLGKFNGWHDSKNTTFQRDMVALRNTSGAEDVDFETVQPPDLAEMAALYAGPIVTVSSYTRNADEDTARRREAVGRLTREGRSNVFFVEGRKYIERLGECAYDGDPKSNTCRDPSDPNRANSRGSPSHRCIGAHGGHPDLNAWGVIEFLFEHLGSTSIVPLLH